MQTDEPVTEETPTEKPATENKLVEETPTQTTVTEDIHT